MMRMLITAVALCALGCDLEAPVPLQTSKPTPTQTTKQETAPASTPAPAHSVRAGQPMRQLAMRYQADLHLHGGALQFERGAVGRLGGAFRVIQVLGAESVILDRLDRDGLPTGAGLIVNGMGTSRIADGETISLGDAVFHYVGTQSYTTVLGAKRTVHVADWIDRDALLATIDELDREAAERQRLADLEREQAIAEARDAVQRSEAKVDEFKAANKRIAQIVIASEKLKLYESAKDSSDAAREQYDAYRKALEDLGPFDFAELQVYTDHLAGLERDLAEARAALRSLR